MNRGIAIALLGAAGALVYYLKTSGTFSVIVNDVKGAIDPVTKIAEGIATAEGFYLSGTRPARDNNPGDMTVDIIGKGIGNDGPFIIYATPDDGWENLKAQVREWLDGISKNADSSSTIADISQFYTNTQQSIWARNVANALGVSVDTPIGQIS